MDLKKYEDRRKFSVFVMVSVFVGESRREERRDKEEFSEVLERWA